MELQFPITPTILRNSVPGPAQSSCPTSLCAQLTPTSNRPTRITRASLSSTSSPHTTASLSYVGTRGIHNYSIANINRSFDGSTYLGDARASNRTNYQYGNINWRGADGDSYYHGVTGELRSANPDHTGLNIRADYTFSHAIDNTSSTFNDSGNEGGGGLVLGYTDPWNNALDRGTSDFNQKHRVAIRNRVGRFLLGRLSPALAKTLAITGPFPPPSTPRPARLSHVRLLATPLRCARAPAFVTAPQRKGSKLTDISSSLGPNTYSYIHLPDYRRCLQRAAQPGCKYLIRSGPG